MRVFRVKRIPFILDINFPPFLSCPRMANDCRKYAYHVTTPTAIQQKSIPIKSCLNFTSNLIYVDTFLLPFLCFSGHIFCIGCPGGFNSSSPLLPTMMMFFLVCFKLQQAKTKSKHFITFFACLFMYCYVFFIVNGDSKRLVVVFFCRVKRS